MRILAGQYKGKKLTLPLGGITRPTLGRVRQVLFDILSHSDLLLGWAGLQVVDGFAGSGSLGLEALSRGAARTDFFESHLKAQQALKQNIENLGVAAHSAVYAEVLQPPRVSQARGLLFFDPPYTEVAQLDGVLNAFHVAGWLDTETLIVIQTPRDADPLCARTLLQIKDVGTTRLGFYRGC